MQRCSTEQYRQQNRRWYEMNTHRERGKRRESHRKNATASKCALKNEINIWYCWHQTFRQRARQLKCAWLNALIVVRFSLLPRPISIFILNFHHTQFVTSISCRHRFQCQSNQMTLILFIVAIWFSLRVRGHHKIDKTKTIVSNGTTFNWKQ